MCASIEAGKVPPSLLPPGQPAIIPAQLGFVAIYNPNLAGHGDGGLHDQIVYHSAVRPPARKPRRRRGGKRTHVDRAGSGDNALQSSDDQEAQRNERLRQVGLAQAMANFARGFANGKPLDAVDTEKSRVVVHELEARWWIVAVSRVFRQNSDMIFSRQNL